MGKAAVIKHLFTLRFVHCPVRGSAFPIIAAVYLILDGVRKIKTPVIVLFKIPVSICTRSYRLGFYGLQRRVRFNFGRYDGV